MDTCTVEIYVQRRKFHVQFGLVYLYLFWRNSLLKCVSQPKIAKSSDAKRSAEASRLAIVRQNGLSSASFRASVAVTPVSRQIWWTTAGASPLLRRPVTVPRFGTNSEDLACRCITSKSGDVTKETQSSFTDDVGDIEQARTTQNLIIKHEIVPADVQDASLAP